MEQDPLKVSAFISAIAQRFRDRADVAPNAAVECALAALEAWEDAGEPVDFTLSCAEDIADEDLRHWESD